MGIDQPVKLAANRPLEALFVLLLPAAAAAAVVQWIRAGAEAALNRSLTYLVVAGIVVAGYAGTVAVLGRLVQHRSAFGVSLVATGLIAVALGPLKLGVQQGVERAMVGSRRSPYVALTTLGSQLSGTPSPEEALAAATRTVGESLRAPHVTLSVAAGTATRGRRVRPSRTHGAGRATRPRRRPGGHPAAGRPLGARALQPGRPAVAGRFRGPDRGHRRRRRADGGTAALACRPRAGPRGGTPAHPPRTARRRRPGARLRRPGTGARPAAVPGGRRAQRVAGRGRRGDAAGDRGRARAGARPPPAGPRRTGPGRSAATAGGHAGRPRRRDGGRRRDRRATRGSGGGRLPDRRGGDDQRGQARRPGSASPAWRGRTTACGSVCATTVAAWPRPHRPGWGWRPCASARSRSAAGWRSRPGCAAPPCAPGYRWRSE